MNLPAGLLPEDQNIEFFGKPGFFGKCFFLQYGQTRPFHEVPVELIPGLYKECFNDKPAVKALEEMGIPREQMVEQYNYCNRGALDHVPDLTPSGKTTIEFVDCGRHGKCVGEGKVCKLEFKGTKLTPRELQCISLNNRGKDYEQIKNAMGFRSITAVNSLMSRCRNKFNAKDRTDLSIKTLGII